MITPHSSFCCPECYSSDLVASVELTEKGLPFLAEQGLICGNCQREYPFYQGVWFLWSDEIKGIYLSDNKEPLDRAANVKKANVDIYKDASEHYEEHTHETHVSAIARMREYACEHITKECHDGDMTIVDVGCAAGIGLSSGADSFANVIGIDISFENLVQVAEKGFTAVLADAEKLPLSDDSIDMVTCFAAMHHLPNHETYIAESFRCLKQGGVALTGGDPSRAALYMSPIARLVWDFRLPVYRLLSKFSSRFYLHKSTDFQQINDIAECHRTQGGFDPEELKSILERVGFARQSIFYGVDGLDNVKYRKPGWKNILLKVLSLQNPFRLENAAELCSLGCKSAEKN